MSGVGVLYERALAGERRALGRLISVVERGGGEAEEITALAHARAGRAHVLGITGPPGAGKSTLTGELLADLARSGRRPAVLAVDPSSSLTGGAILGDRIRMGATPEGAFVRSMAARGHRGGLSIAVPDTVRVLDAVGFDPVLVETTGIGQAEVDLAEATDTTALVLAPGWGDAVQANKAGLIEIADVLVLNKADRPEAEGARRDLELMLDLGHVSGHDRRRGGRPDIVLTTATSGEGVPALRAAVDAHRSALLENGALIERRRRRLRHEVSERLEAILLGHREELVASEGGLRALEEAERGEISPSEAARRLARAIVARV